MLTDIEETYQRIRYMDSSCERFCVTPLRLPFLALATISTALSRASEVTSTLALVPTQRLPFSSLCLLLATSTYLNMVTTKEYNTLDSRKQELMTLKTKIEILETQLNKQKTVLATSGDGVRDTNAASGFDRTAIPGTSVQRWRITTQGVLIVVDGKTYWWCEQ